LFQSAAAERNACDESFWRDQARHDSFVFPEARKCADSAAAE
jgi:hypothetical protein